ncbi:MAG: iron-siderophore ABC transporter substrate-binding protein [Cyanomargarita calcarea GSE-NOS-MK-12-04C]|jgi:iron complex transport system substrate-binding protein|uniref:Iron-siderophore ABC transporter substrate-binding protein n=1 Tax=Cyanomargarita calcarea GSE-NOS-MK-12-04C TaxID=2839659 RepID=A0A951QY09_9CYAN|nr:iron-siderophore ABC transporter substrate-binding protein [Cyanomargarita calcarea GSE-NOS-MK-12-04C]
MNLQYHLINCRFKILCTGIITSILLAGCGGQTALNKTSNINKANSISPTSQNKCQSIQHKLGKTQICNESQKVVALNPKMLDILLSIDIQPIGFADAFAIHKGNYDNPRQQIPYLGSRVSIQPTNLGTSSQPSLESIVKLKPDLILGDARGNNEDYKILSQIAPTLLFSYVGADDDKWQDIIKDIAKIFGRTQKAQKVIENYQKQLTYTRKLLAPVAATYPKVLMLSSEQLKQNLRIVNSTDFCGGIIEDLGFQLVSISNVKQQSINQAISIEILPKLDADLIIIQAHNISAFAQLSQAKGLESNQLEKLKQQWQKSALAQSLKATKKGHVYFVPTYLCLGLPGPIGAEIFLNEIRQKLPTSIAKT